MQGNPCMSNDYVLIFPLQGQSAHPLDGFLQGDSAFDEVFFKSGIKRRLGQNEAIVGIHYHLLVVSAHHKHAVGVFRLQLANVFHHFSRLGPLVNQVPDKN